MSLSVPPPGYEPPPTPASAPSAPAQPVVRTAAPRRSIPSKLIAGGVVLLAAVAVAFVAFGSTNSPVTDPIAQAATLSSGTPGYRMSMSLTIGSPTTGTPLSMSGNAIVDLRDQAASISFAMDVSQEPQLAQQLGSTTMRLAMIVDQGTMYMKLPQGLTNAVPGLGGTTWLKIDLGNVKGLPGLSSVGNNPTTSDPSHVLQYLRAAANGVSNEGTQVVDGVVTTHYSAMVSLDQLSANVPSGDAAAVQRTLSELEQSTGMHAFPINVWVDADHLVRRVAMTMSLHGAGGAPVQEDLTADFSNYGPQRRPTPPPADQVTDLSNLIHASGG